MVSYRIIRSKRKSMGLEINTELEVLVRAPKWVSEARIATFVEQHQDWIAKKLESRRALLEKYPEPTEEQLAAWLDELRAIVPARVEYYARIMGVAYTGIRFNRNRVNIGSCTAQNRLAFSCRLMGYPPEVLDYVVVHELAHVTHKNHGADFWRAVETVLPDYRERRAMLRG